MEIHDRWNALSSGDQQRILDKHRWELNFHDSWWEGIYENFIVDVNELGYMVDETNGRNGRHCIWFSGFASQGDGACFDGRVWQWHKALEKFPLVLEHIKDTSVDKHLSWKSHGNYNHKHTLRFDENLDTNNPYDEHDERLRWLAHESITNELIAQWDAFVKHTEKQVHDLCDKLYSALEEEHDYLSSDECVLESLIADDMLEDELKEYEYDCEESESTGSPDQCADHPATGPLLLGPLGDAPETGGGPDAADAGCGREEHLLQP